MSISEGESDLVLNLLEHNLIDDAVHRMFDLLADAKDSFGCGGRRDRYGYWADSKTLMTAMRAILIEAANVRSVVMKARQMNENLWAPGTPSSGIGFTWNIPEKGRDDQGSSYCGHEHCCGDECSE